MKRILLLFSALMTSISALWAHDVEIDGIYYNLNKTNKTATVTYRGYDYGSYDNEYSGSVTIPETITYNSQTYSVTSIGYSAFWHCIGLTSVTIPNSVTSIADNAFIGCSGLTSVSIGESVTSIGYLAFSDCIGLTSATIPNSVASIGARAFEDCIGLTSVTIPNSVTSIGYEAFSGCIGLTSVTIPNSVKSIGDEVFYNCSGLTKVIWNAKNCGDFSSSTYSPFYDIRSNITSFRFGNEVEHIPAYLCYEMSKLTEIAIPNSVTSIGSSAFSGCSGLTSVSIPNSVTSIGSSAFSGCNGLTSVIWNAKNCGDFSSSTYSPFYDIRSNITSFRFGNEVEHIPAYLCYGIGITEITIPNSVKSIGNAAFYNCSGLIKVNYLGTVDKWVEIDFDDYDSNPTYYAKDLYINNELLTDIKITTANSIKDYAFYNCQSIKSVEIGNSVTSIGSSAFSGCSGLTSVSIPNSVTSIASSAFSGCNGLTSVIWNAKNYGDFSSSTYSPFYDIRSNITSFRFGNEVEHIPAYLCNEMSKLTEIAIPNSVTSIGTSAFEDCSGLTSVSIGESVTSIGSYAFDDCSGLTSITIPNSVTSIGSSAFSGCNGLTSVIWNAKNCKDFKYNTGNGITTSPFYNIRSNITSFTFGNEVEHIPAFLCYGMSKLTEMTIPNSVTSIGSSAFSGCNGLTSVIWNAKNCGDFSSSTYSPFYDIRSNITSFRFGNEVEHIPAYLCYEMSKLTEITIPISVTSIGSYAFDDCSGLTSITIPNSVTSIGSSAFSGCSGLTSVIWNAQNYKDFEDYDETPFYNIRSSITSFTFGNEVEHISAYLCYEMTGLTEVEIPTSVKSIGENAFNYCNNLKKINYNSTIDNWVEIDFANATSNPINYAENLYINEELVSEIKIEKAESIKQYAFIYCKGLKYVEVGSSVKSIGASAFNYCSNLKTVYNKSKLDIIKGKTTHGYIAYYAKVVGKVENGFIYDAENTLIDYIGDTTLVSIDLPNVIEEIIPGIFNRFPNLTSIRMGDNVKQIASDAFDGCDNLKEINISSDNSYFSSEDGVLYNKNKTTLIKFPKAKESSSFTILKSIKNINENAFAECNKLTSIVWNSQKCNDFESVEHNPLYNIKENITSIVFGDSVEHIPAYLCYEMNKLSEISVPVSLLTIGSEAFYNCDGITSVKWNAVNCENFTVSTAPFNSICSNITSFVFGNEVEHIPAYICYNMGNIADIAITNNITTIGTDAFFGCSGLTSILWNAKKSEDFLESTAPFNNICTKITSLTFGEEVEHIPAYLCNGMAKVTPKEIPNSVKSIGKYAFWGTRVYKTNWDDGVLYIDSCLIKAENEELEDTYQIKEGTRVIADEAFLACNILNSISFPKSISSIGKNAFTYCENLTEIVVPNNIVYMGWEAFSGCNKLSSIIWNVKKCEDFESYEKSPFYNIRDRITSFTFGDEVEYIPAYLCYGMRNINQIAFPASVDVIGKYSFSDCDGLRTIVISDGVSTINDFAFSGCNYINDLQIGKNVQFIGKNVFQYCNNLDNIVWNAKNCSNFESPMQSPFYSIMSNISSFKIGNGVEYIPAYLCYGMDNLYSIIIPENVTAIGKEAFSNCDDMKSIIWKAKNCSDFSSLSESPFYNSTNENIAYFTFGNNVEHIPSYLCYGMDGLTEVLIPHRVTSIGDSVFYNCENLVKVISYPRSVPTTGEEVFAHYNAYLYVQCVSLDDYVDDDTFGMFKRIKCIEVDEVELEKEDDSEKVEIEIDKDNNNATIIWPSTENANSYELVISRKGKVFCTLIFNKNGQLLSIDFSKRSATVGFKFTVTGLEEASKYDYSLLALDENNNELESYYGEFETNGYVEGEDDEEGDDNNPGTAILETLADANITVSGGTISADTEFSIYNTVGQDVTALNGSLQPGVYVVSMADDVVKVMMK